ncbi:hypothetical protein QTN47_07335 [Danxiaibacter flavus]|uniref:DUF4468 domain-containing protein n=1 Tax=Danxiaibacter flavus TaxID=3049108 RepID=A0ABV3ZBQ8_9BACT|nr:hypothetical protein QNM32_07335 [Chitinophagaceae bacterium DXS]
MRRLANSLVICVVLSVNVSAQIPPTGILPYRDGRIYYAFNYTIATGSFTSSVKRPLAQYADQINKQITESSRNMKNYLLYEDSMRIISNVKFVTTNNGQAALYEGVATFVNLHDSVNVILNDLTLIQSAQRKDLSGIGEPAEKSDYRKNKPAMQLLGNAIESFIKRYNGRLLDDN